MLTPQQLTHYHEQGFVIPDFRLPASTIQSIKDDFERLLMRYPEFRQNCPSLLTYDTTFLNYARNPDILDMVTQILGEDIAVWNSSYFGKPAHDGKRVPWHQDGRYWPIRPLASCSVWIAIDDSNTENGCLRIIPGSHKSRKLFRHESNPATTSFFRLNSCDPNLTKAPLWTLPWNRDRFRSTMSIWCTVRNPTPPVNPAAA